MSHPRAKVLVFVFFTATLSKAQAPLWGEPIPGRPSQRKENSPMGSRWLLQIGCVTALDASRHPSLPLWIWGSEPDSLSVRVLAYLSGQSDPCSTAVHVQRF